MLKATTCLVQRHHVKSDICRASVSHHCDAHRSKFDMLELVLGTDDEGIAARRAGHSIALPGNTATTNATVSNGSVRPRGPSHINNLKDAQYLHFAFGP